MSAVSGIGSTSADIKTNYLTLLVAQLQNQNPLEPMDNNQMATQLSQLSSLEKLESMDTNFQKALLTARMTEATGLLGRQVTYVTGQGGLAVGTVEAAGLLDGDVWLKVGSETVGLDEIRTVG